MTTVGVGIDVVDVARFRLALERRPKIVERLFTEGERRDARARPERLAARFAAKEAVMKTMKVGVGSAPWRSIEVTLDDAGAPSVLLHAPTRELATTLGLTTLHLSMTHTEQTAAAFVVGTAAEESRGR
ncbi:MAG TPA: holo-ACP synthase [Acidimicrobiales bacterium]